MAKLINYSHFLPFLSRGLSSVIQSAAAVVPRQWSLGSFPCPKHQLSKCPERDDGQRTITLTITDSPSTPDPISPPPNPNSTNVPATSPSSVSNSVIITNNFPVLHSNIPPSTTSPCTLSSPTLQIHLLVPPSLLSLCELLLGTGSESPAFCAPASCPLRHHHSQRQRRASTMYLVPATRVCGMGEQLQVEETLVFYYVAV